MTGESDVVRARALQRLRQMPNLENTLRKELEGPRKELALDTISALGMSSLIPDLLKATREDQSGFVYIALNNLMTSKNLAEMMKFYKKQLLCKFHCKISGPAQVVIIETLARLNEELDIEDLEYLFTDTKWPEVQAAVLDYARMAILRHNKENYAPLLRLGFHSEIIQLREQAQFIVSAMPEPLRTKWSAEAAGAPQLDLKITRDLPQQVRVAFGYKDARPARFVADRYERLYLIQSLVKPCETNQDLICDFKRDKNDLNIFTKRIRTSEGESPLLRLYITASAAGPDDDDNRLNPYQNHLSKASRFNFMEGLRSAEAVFYIGHSRDGGGPDFNPPQLRDDMYVDYPWYRKNKPGLGLVLKNLKAPKKTKRSPFKLGLLSCDSTQHFEKTLKGASKIAKVITVPRLIYYSDALKMLEDEISKYIRLKFNDYGQKN